MRLSTNQMFMALVEATNEAPLQVEGKSEDYVTGFKDGINKLLELLNEKLKA